MRISDWSSDVCSSDLLHTDAIKQRVCNGPFSGFKCTAVTFGFAGAHHRLAHFPHDRTDVGEVEVDEARHNHQVSDTANTLLQHRSEEHTSELQSLMRISYAVFCLQKKTAHTHTTDISNRSKD